MPPQQRDQTSPVDNQHSAMSGRLPYNTTPQEQYTQSNQRAQSGTCLFALIVMCDYLGHELNIILLSPFWKQNAEEKACITYNFSVFYVKH